VVVVVVAVTEGARRGLWERRAREREPNMVDVLLSES
jgi:hypothetical protein